MKHHEGSWKGVLYGVGIAAFAAYQQFKLPVVLPVLLQRYGYERTLAGAFMSVYALAGLVASLWLGRVVERRGAVRPVLGAMVAITAGSLLTLVDPAAGWLVLVARAMEGLGFAALAVSGPVLAHANARVGHGGFVAGLSAMWIPIGQLTATVLAPIALATTGWPLLWWIGIAGAVIVALITGALRRDPRVTLAPALRAGGAPGTLARHERSSLWLVASVFGLWSGQYFAYMTWLPQYLVEVYRLPVQAALLGYVVPVVFVALFNLVTGALLRRGVALGGLMTVTIASQALIWWLLPYTGRGWTGVASLVAYGVGSGIVPTCLFGSPNAVVGAGRSTAPALGILMTGRNLGVLIGPVLLAWVAGGGGKWNEGAVVFGALTAIATVLAGVFWLRVRRR